MKAFIEKSKCASDSRICKPLNECPQKAISWIEDDDEPLGSRMKLMKSFAMVAVSAWTCVVGKLPKLSENI